MRSIIPAIIPTSRAHLEEALASLAPITHSVQIDIVDGVFVPSVSWPYSGGEVSELVRLASDFEVEVDLMVAKPEEVVEQYLRAGAKRIVIHLESTDRLADIVGLKARYDFRLGLSILNDTDISTLTSKLEHTDYIQLMGIAEIGSQGQPFDERVLEKIVFLKKEYPSIEISIDGSVSNETLPRLVAAGADRFAVGSAIMHASDMRTAYEELVQRANDV